MVKGGVAGDRWLVREEVTRGGSLPPVVNCLSVVGNYFVIRERVRE